MKNFTVGNNCVHAFIGPDKAVPGGNNPYQNTVARVECLIHRRCFYALVPELYGPEAAALCPTCRDDIVKERVALNMETRTVPDSENAKTTVGRPGLGPDSKPRKQKTVPSSKLPNTAPGGKKRLAEKEGR